MNDFPPNSADWATLNNKKDCIGVLLEFKADTEIENKEGDRPVDIAVKYNLEDVTVRKSRIILNSRKCSLLQA
jgi:ankyrin repeat protein